MCINLFLLSLYILEVGLLLNLNFSLAPHPIIRLKSLGSVFSTGLNWLLHP